MHDKKRHLKRLGKEDILRYTFPVNSPLIEELSTQIK